MKKFFVLFFCLCAHHFLYAQNYKYAWITDSHIGAPDADNDLKLVVNDINLREEVKFVVVTGDVAEKGRNSELEQAKEILDGLKKTYYIIPGNHDTKWSESGCTKFKELWREDKFIFDFKNTRHIGINSGIPWRGGGGHVSVEDLDWLKNILKETASDKEIIFYTHHPLDGDVDNWFEVTNLLSHYNIKVIFVGHGHSNQLMNFGGIPAAMGRSTLSRPKLPGYTMVEIGKDSIKLFEVKVDSIPHLWGLVSKNIEWSVPKVDSLQFIKYSSKVEMLGQKDLQKSISTSLLIDGNKIFCTTIDGDVSCYDILGNKIWQTNLGQTVFSRPEVSGNILAVATIEGDLFTLKTDNGDIIQTLGINEALTSQLIISEVEYNGELTKAVIIGSASGKIYCYSLNTLEFIWENNSASQMIETMPIIEQDKVIFGSWDNYLNCLSKNTGSLIWKWTENKNFYYSPAACWPVTDGKNVFVTTPDKFTSAIDINLGSTTWRKKDYDAWESIGISRDKTKIIVKSILDKLHILSAKDGKPIKEIKVGFSLDTMPIQLFENDGNIVFGSKSGTVYLIDKSYNVTPLFFMGTSRVHSVQHIKGNIYTASNMDGKIVIFKIEN